jgi:hypothetical protein
LKEKGRKIDEKYSKINRDAPDSSVWIPIVRPQTQSRNVLMLTLFNELFVTILLKYIASNYKMANETLKNVSKEADAGSFKVRSQDLLGGSEENHENPQKESRLYMDEESIPIYPV